MNKIIYIGMDVHSSNYTLCSFEPGYGICDDKVFGQVQFKDDFIKNTEKYILNLKKQRKGGDLNYLFNMLILKIMCKSVCKCVCKFQKYLRLF